MYDYSRRNFKLFLCGVVFVVFFSHLLMSCWIFFGLIGEILLKDIFPQSKLSVTIKTDDGSSGTRCKLGTAWVVMGSAATLYMKVWMGWLSQNQ